MTSFEERKTLGKVGLTLEESKINTDSKKILKILHNYR